ncbi:MAG: molybdenum cofactor guanylyltransferase MobA [Burkholderiaceae bacterium]|nr:molybdenum cofactor guanylyltransferase MobA [Burkholderiaceae bacterium]
MTIARADITGLILAGGRGSRMNDSDKGLQLLDGKPLVQHALDRLRPQVGSVCISANRNREQYGAFGLPVFGDDFPGYAGPLAGIHAGLSRCATPWLACVPCDSPALPADLVARLAAAIAAGGADLAFAATGSGQTHRRHPVCCLLRTTLLPNLAAYLESGGRKVGAWHTMLKSVEVHFTDEEAFRNINSLPDLRDIEEAQR